MANATHVQQSHDKSATTKHKKQHKDRWHSREAQRKDERDKNSLRQINKHAMGKQ